ncbi:MAG: hypothetical protein UT66_C0039G0004 [candidate division CPR2 bacterium GW2011_GWC1_39_9]|nr:MAG: hypothetical protein UT66_C0039G0004 [candidate division CPR2 bacterium GW2011_GWC1_39_9]
MYLIFLRGSFLPKYTPAKMAIISAAKSPKAEPAKTCQKELYLAAKEKVASWVLSPNSAKKNNKAIVKTILKALFSFMSFAFSSFSSFLKDQIPKEINRILFIFCGKRKR